ncbi:XRE family transcriptional regulator [Dietzia sp. oral taxon 368]|uniref:helix-turn-helix domain-containing protein n=1 Tax=Dietzia sp. oral taxon 368 TaxID=712270 RepID=UPI000D095FCD|nr:helix-turn-helix transcriptional regulator [Dietzia sp. oral taxon 368]AVM63986.1 XRE family transcriptional regulator [Dietzia sp. oral taxon 368]
MTPDEARSLGRAIRAARTERGVSQLKLAHAVGVSNGQLSIWERGRVPTARGRTERTAEVSRTQLEEIASALGCTAAEIADRAALTATTRLLFGLEPLGPARTVIGGREFDLTDEEADRVADFAAGLLASRDLRHQTVSGSVT